MIEYLINFTLNFLPYVTIAMFVATVGVMFSIVSKHFFFDSKEKRESKTYEAYKKYSKRIIIIFFFGILMVGFMRAATDQSITYKHETFNKERHVWSGEQHAVRETTEVIESNYKPTRTREEREKDFDDMVKYD